jgi:hypothetical protein
MNYERSFVDVIYRIKHIDEGLFGSYEGNDYFPQFEFLTEKNARKYIEEQHLTHDVVIEKVSRKITENVIQI